MCEVTGLPIPAISWVLDGQKLEEEDGEAAFKNGVATMLMEDAMTEDSGVYECVAKNSEGEARTRCNVKVTSGKSLLNLQNMYNVSQRIRFLWLP